MELDLAYAITIHKSQGSEFAAVIIPVLTQHFKNAISKFNLYRVNPSLKIGSVCRPGAKDRAVKCQNIVNYRVYFDKYPV